MSKHENTFTAATEIDPDLLRRTEAAVLRFMAENDGKMPTQQQANEVVRTSFTRLGPAFRAVKEHLLATQTRLANMPEIPDDLRLAHEQMLKDMWARTRELQNGEIVDLRRAQAAKDESHRQDTIEMQEIVAQIEAERDREAARAVAAEKEAADHRSRLDAALIELAAANARLAERDAIFAMLMPGAAPDAESDVSGAGVTKPGKANRRAPKTEEAETFDLPMTTEEPSGITTAGK